MGMIISVNGETKFNSDKTFYQWALEQARKSDARQQKRLVRRQFRRELFASLVEGDAKKLADLLDIPVQQIDPDYFVIEPDD